MVSRGGRVDLAGETLAQVQAPTLLTGTANAEWYSETVRRCDCSRAARSSYEYRVLDRSPSPARLGSVAEHTVKWLDD